MLKTGPGDAAGAYGSLYEYWCDMFAYLDLVGEASNHVWDGADGSANSSPVIPKTKKAEAAHLRAQRSAARAAERISERVRETDDLIPFEYFCDQLHLGSMARRLYATVYRAALAGESLEMGSLLRSIVTDPIDLFLMRQEIDAHPHLFMNTLTSLPFGPADRDAPIFANSSSVSIKARFMGLICSDMLYGVEDADARIDEYIQSLQDAAERVTANGVYAPAMSPRQDQAMDDGSVPLWTVKCPEYRLDRVVMSDSVRERMDEVQQYMDNDTRKLLVQWGQLRPDQYNVSILLHGPSGTGKSSLAEAIAARYGAQLWRVDASGIFSKWIGNTEKNTRAVFAAYAREVASTMRDQHAPPFFLWLDEADQLLSKRVDVGQSNDAMHNRVQNVILEELQSFRGVLIATTNLTTNLDDAYTRRFKFSIEVPVPAARERELLWRQFLGDRLPLADDVDPAAMAAQHTLTGAQIERIVERAALMAASRRSACVSREIIERSIEVEKKSKVGRKTNEIRGFVS